MLFSYVTVSVCFHFTGFYESEKVSYCLLGHKLRLLISHKPLQCSLFQHFISINCAVQIVQTDQIFLLLYQTFKFDKALIFPRQNNSKYSDDDDGA